MAAKEIRSGSHISQESVKIIAESIGISNINDEAAKILADDISYRMKVVIQDSKKFTCHAKRRKLSVQDFDYSLRMKNIEPIYGFTSNEFIPFRFASGGGREIFFTEEKEIELNDNVAAQMSKLPLDVTVKSHWLSIEGVQPTIAENPPPVSKDQQKNESMEIGSKLSKLGGNKGLKDDIAKQLEIVRLKQLATHELSVEQQLYYKEITEACVGSDESRRAEALQSLSSDPGLFQTLPRLSQFISEGVKVNVVQNNLALLIYLMRMVKALLDNQTLFLEKYLHELIPAVCSCIVSKQLCTRPEVDNHWALRDFASRLICQITKSFNTTTSNVQTRVTRMFSRALSNEKMPLASHYGAISGLSELGPEVIRSFILPRMKTIGERVRQVVENNMAPTVDKTSAEHVKNIVLRVLSPVLKTATFIGDSVEDYKNEFGYLGPLLHSHVARVKQQAPTVTPSAKTPFAISQQPRMISSITRPPTLLTVPRSTPVGSPSPTGQKYVLVAPNSRPGAPMASGLSPQPSSTPTLVKIATPMAMGKTIVNPSLAKLMTLNDGEIKTEPYSQPGTPDMSQYDMSDNM